MIAVVMEGVHLVQKHERVGFSEPILPFILRCFAPRAISPEAELHGLDLSELDRFLLLSSLGSGSIDLGCRRGSRSSWGSSRLSSRLALGSGGRGSSTGSSSLGSCLLGGLLCLLGSLLCKRIGSGGIGSLRGEARSERKVISCV